MPLGNPINPIIRRALEDKRKVLGREKTPDPYSSRESKAKKDKQKHILKSTYIYMMSTSTFEQDEVERAKLPSGTIVLGNQEYSPETTGYLNFGQYMYTNKQQGYDTSGQSAVGSRVGRGNTGQIRSSRAKKSFTPPAGVTSLPSEFLSSNNVQFVRHITINWTCFSLEDLEVLGERFLTLGRKVYVEWGFAKNQPTRPALLDSDGRVRIPENMTNDKESEATRLHKKVLLEGQGEFDAVVGYVNNFNWSSREDGGFNCTTEVTIQGLNAQSGPSDINNDTDEEGEEKFRDTPDKGVSKFSFNQALQDLPSTAVNIILSKAQATNKATSIRDANTLVKLKQLEKINEFNESVDAEEEIGFTQVIRNYQTAKGLITEGTEKGFVDEFINTQQIILDDRNFIVTQNNIEEVKDSWDSVGTFYNPSAEKSADTLNKQVKNRSLTDVTNYFQKFRKRPSVLINIKADNPPERCWVRWGWFEDNILNKFLH